MHIEEHVSFPHIVEHWICWHLKRIHVHVNIFGPCSPKTSIVKRNHIKGPILKRGYATGRSRSILCLRHTSNPIWLIKRHVTVFFVLSEAYIHDMWVVTPKPPLILSIKNVCCKVSTRRMVSQMVYHTIKSVAGTDILVRQIAWRQILWFKFETWSQPLPWIHISGHHTSWNHLV